MLNLSSEQMLQLIFERCIDGKEKTLVVGIDGYSSISHLGKVKGVFPPERLNESIQIYCKIGTGE